MESRSFIIPAANKISVERQIEKLNRRAKRIGIDQIILTWGKAFMDRKQLLIPDSKDPSLPPQYLDKTYLALPVEVEGSIDICHNGWQFLATIQHLSTGENIIRPIMDVDIPKKYRTAGSNCEHCNINRYRKDTYLVIHETGIIVQVGSTCIKDHLGNETPENIIQRANFIAELMSFLEGSKKLGSVRSIGSAPNYDELFHIEVFLKNTSAAIRQFGWRSKGKAQEEGGIPTAKHVEDRIYYGSGSFLVSDYDKELANKAAEWAENLSDQECDDSDYLFNIRAISRSGMVGFRTFGFAASIIPAYQKTQKSQIKNNSRYVGEIGDKIQIDLTFKNSFSFMSSFGYCSKYIFEDVDTNVFTWTTSPCKDFNKGESYKIKGTIKGHNEYKGTEQTVLTRCKVVK